MPETSNALTPAQITAFITDGFVRIDNAFPADLAAGARAILWAATGCNPDDPATWTKPVIRLGEFSQPPFREAVNTPTLRAAYNQLVGPGRWLPRGGLGTFPVRFPNPQDEGDTGWHIDASFGDDNPDFLEWRANINSRGRALLMLFLFSDVGADDAPTRIRPGSHLEVARYLAPAGEDGRSLRDMLTDRPDWFDTGREALATGPAGTVYLCHPFLVHAAQIHRGKTVKFMAQPPLLPAEPLQLERADNNYSPVERAIRLALG
ncbi:MULTISPECIES: phytanoyl-CoA dioxygenase family protein [unclassified Devosia]|uniref:phytanoyl-CoA dioxygenase family protein n=1 Tax=unclassified Devosia TaxID=196773 RepID=UPI000FDB710B|nr:MULTISPECIES: phytanoyl-CoA dioxygenase family protein [unclassified Devosia]